MGTAERGDAAVAKLHFPGLGKDGAELLVARGIDAVGIDTPSIDHGQSKNFETHVALMTNDIPAFENVADMSALPPTGATIVALPMKIEGGVGRAAPDRRPPADSRRPARSACAATSDRPLSGCRCRPTDSAARR